MRGSSKRGRPRGSRRGGPVGGKVRTLFPMSIASSGGGDGCKVPTSSNPVVDSAQHGEFLAF